jgi:DNA-binding IclR family transcriptional regulator
MPASGGGRARATESVSDVRDELSSVEKALRVVEVLGTSTGLGLSETARRSGVAKTTCLRLLRALEARGFVTRDGKTYRLSWRLLELNRGVLHCEPGGLRDIAHPHLSELHQLSGWSVNLAVLDGPDVLYLTRIHRAGTVRLPGGTGSRVPATCTAIGKAILAFQPEALVHAVVAHGLPALTPYSVTSVRVLETQLAETRTVGLAREREESSLGVACIAAPILNRGSTIAAISVSGRVDRQVARPLDGLLRKAAALTASDYAARSQVRR